MRNEFDYPFLAKPLWMIVVFALFLVAFHILLVKVWPLQKQAWKKVDYIWLGVAALAIIGTAGAHASSGGHKFCTARDESG